MEVDVGSAALSNLQIGLLDGEGVDRKANDSCHEALVMLPSLSYAEAGLEEMGSGWNDAPLLDTRKKCIIDGDPGTLAVL